MALWLKTTFPAYFFPPFFAFSFAIFLFPHLQLFQLDLKLNQKIEKFEFFDHNENLCAKNKVLL